MQTIKIILFVSILGLSQQPLFAQESILKDQFEKSNEGKYCFYPSTLRMVNIKQNADFNELATGVEKLLIYQLDSSSQANKSYREVSEKYQSVGFEEYASAQGGGMSLSIVGKSDRRQQEFAGYMWSDELAVAFYLRGDIPWQKIPTLIKSMEDLDLIEIF
ncbi:MAG: DUF4252 domain-containing protein [Cyclobacteriaceae bacterium]